MKKSIKCICCSQKIKPLDRISDKENLENNMWRDGEVGTIMPGYGSRYDMTLFYIGICDDCIEEKLKEKVLVIKKEYYENF
jgi:hypothetical protein